MISSFKSTSYNIARRAIRCIVKHFLNHAKILKDEKVMMDKPLPDLIGFGPKNLGISIQNSSLARGRRFSYFHDVFRRILEYHVYYLI